MANNAELDASLRSLFSHDRPFGPINAGKIDAKASGREVRDGDITPACVQSCTANALVFGDLNDPNSAVSRLSRSPRGSKLLEELGTQPKVTYLERESWHETEGIRRG